MGGNVRHSEITSTVDALDCWLIRPGCRNAILVVMPNHLHCSFCNQSVDQTGPLLAKMDTEPKALPVRSNKPRFIKAVPFAVGFSENRGRQLLEKLL